MEVLYKYNNINVILNSDKVLVLHCGDEKTDGIFIDIENYNIENEILKLSPIDRINRILVGYSWIEDKFIQTLETLFKDSIFDNSSNFIRPINKSNDSGKQNSKQNVMMNQQHSKSRHKSYTLLTTAYEILDSPPCNIHQREHFARQFARLPVTDEQTDQNSDNNFIIENTNVPFERTIYRTNWEWKAYSRKLERKLARKRSRHQNKNDIDENNKKFMLWKQFQEKVRQFRVEFEEFDQFTKQQYIKQLQHDDNNEIHNLRHFRIVKSNYKNGVCDKSAFEVLESGQHLRINGIGWKYLIFKVYNQISDLVFKRISL